MSVSFGGTKAALLSTLGDHLRRLPSLLTALPASHLPLLGEWAKLVWSERQSPDRLDALRRAQRRAEADIRAALERLADEFDVLSHDVDDAMSHVSDSIQDLTWGVERELIHEVDHPVQYEEHT
ncbi:hypothetical protein [Reyranella sp.]|uniref:hypothetical protein n=1 Tax=Reyranella sp. TaxID=1929291 RepID=UPI003D0BD829